VRRDLETVQDGPYCASYSMKKLGLALAGGGFRASLYHLGLLRFLRDAGILQQVTHITSVSGGSVMAAHLVLNWDRYNGDDAEFKRAASEFLSFIHLDVRNRIIRRFPFALLLRWPRRLLGLSNHQLTRTGLLEYHYERYLFGEKSLFELPDKPRLHILATNVSEGCLCSFDRDGLLMVRRQPGGTYRMDRIHVGLATVAMAVAASSAFPGFFPPLELTGADVGASAGEFGLQTYTDGGVFDNLGVRMFHSLQRSLLAEGPLQREDFVDFQATVAAVLEASKSPDETPLRRLAQILVAACRQPDLLLHPSLYASSSASGLLAGANRPPASLPQLPAGSGAWIGDNEDLVLSVLGNVMRQYQFRLDPLFMGQKPLEPEAEALLRASRVGGQTLGPGDQLWLNRHLLEASFRQATGRPCFSRLNSGLDGVLVSDVGKAIEVVSNRSARGLIRIALRASDILMDRVWQLEVDKFHDVPGYVFAPITDVVEPAEDATVMHPEVQRQVAVIRTDLDRFSPLEISSLVRHGYCVGRKACRAHPDLFGANLPGDAPWDPIPALRGAAPAGAAVERQDAASRTPAAATTVARKLQCSAVRRIWTTLLDWRDWVSYLYVPILVPILVLLPYIAIRVYEHTHRLNQLVQSFAQGTHDLDTLTEMLDSEPAAWTSGEHAERVHNLEVPTLKGFEILQDSRIVDLRAWQPAQSAAQGIRNSRAHVYRRLKVARQETSTDDALFRLHLLQTSPKTFIRFPPQQLQPKLLMTEKESSAPGQEDFQYEVRYDFAGVPVGEHVDLIVDELSPAQFMERGQNGTQVSFPVQAETAELATWILMPEGREYKEFHVSRHENDKPEKTEAVKLATEYLSDDYTILAFRLLALKPGYTYELSWLYK
jgi:predicted acylesterase/phospholipase RssA